MFNTIREWFAPKNVLTDKRAREALELTGNLNYPIDTTLDSVLYKLLTTSALTEVKQQPYEIDFAFSNGIKFVNVWNSNKYYAWLNKGKIINESEVLYEWNDSCVTPITMATLKVKIAQFCVGRILSHQNFSLIKHIENIDNLNQLTRMLDEIDEAKILLQKKIITEL